jgi:hypothetical protein
MIKYDYITIKTDLKNLLKTIDNHHADNWKYFSCDFVYEEEKSFFKVKFEREVMLNDSTSFYNRIPAVNSNEDLQTDTRAEILAQYPNYNFIAKDESGDWYVFKSRPILNKSLEMWVSLFLDYACCTSAKFYGSWEDSLYSKGDNLRGADFRGANLQGADLREANLQGAELERANFRGDNF